MSLEGLFTWTTRRAPSAPMRETVIAPTMLPVIPDLDSSPSAWTDASRRTSDRDRGPRNQAWTPPGASCLRCGGLLVPSYTASLERDVTGTPVTLWRCVNCGDCVDHDILANRGKGSGSARVRVRSPAGPQYIGRLRGAGTGMTR